MTSAEQQLLAILHTKGGLDEVKRRLLLDAYIEAASPPKMSLDEYLDWLDEDTFAEWVNGRIIVMSPASRQHQIIVDFLVAILRPYSEKNDLGEAISAPFPMKLNQSGREPDLLFVLKKNLKRMKPTFLDGPADLVVEVISEESIGRDRGDKYYEYEKAGISEYWLIDPLRDQVEFYQLDARGRFQLIRPDEAGLYYSKIVAGLALPVNWLFSPPPVLEALRSLGII